MTEDDTFNRLRRISVDKMINIIIEARNAGDNGDLEYLLIENGWNPEDYQVARLAYFGGRYG